jgi:hypothetical protein
MMFFIPTQGGSSSSSLSLAQASNSLTEWSKVTGVWNISLSRTNGDEWIGVIPAQAGGVVLRWAVYVEDYAGNSNYGDLAVGAAPLTYGPDTQSQIEVGGGYALIGLIFFGIIFGIAYRVNSGVQSVKRAKKVSTPVKKTPGSKTIGGPGKKMPISKDIVTKVCPVR